MSTIEAEATPDKVISIVGPNSSSMFSKALCVRKPRNMWAAHWPNSHLLGLTSLATR
ncbi:MAG: hypothetical protein ACYC1I_12180 [Acidimicrobiales bacterium]